jgi:hypothetical protein
MGATDNILFIFNSLRTFLKIDFSGFRSYSWVFCFGVTVPSRCQRCEQLLSFKINQSTRALSLLHSGSCCEQDMAWHAEVSPSDVAAAIPCTVRHALRLFDSR